MRHWKTVSTSFATLCARLSSTAGNLIVLGIAARRMSHDQVGLFIILINLNLLTNGFDLGFRFTLGNRLAALGSRGAAAEEERRETFLSILFLQVLISLSYMLLLFACYRFIPWARWLNIIDPLLIAETLHLMPVVMVLMVGSLPLALMWTVFFAYQEIKLASFLTGISTIIQTTIFVVAAYRFDFMRVVVIYFSASLAVGALLTGYVFVRRKWRFALVPISRMITIIRSLARVSFHAFFLTMNGIISQILGTLISGRVSGLGAAADFNFVLKLFSFLSTAHLALLAPVSPAVTLESHSGNWDAVRRRLRVCVLQVWPAVFLLVGGVVWCAHPALIRVWTGHWLTKYPLATVLFAWACLNGFVNTFSVFLNSLGLVKVQAAVSFALILPNILLPALLSRWLGVPGIALGMLLCAVPAAIIWPFYTRRALRLQLLRV